MNWFLFKLVSFSVLSQQQRTKLGHSFYAEVLDPCMTEFFARVRLCSSFILLPGIMQMTRTICWRCCLYSNIYFWLLCQESVGWRVWAYIYVFSCIALINMSVLWWYHALFISTALKQDKSFMFPLLCWCLCCLLREECSYFSTHRSKKKKINLSSRWKGKLPMELRKNS